MALTHGPPPSPTDPAPSWAPEAAPPVPAAATPPAQAAVFAAMALAITIVCIAVEEPPYSVLGIAALAIGVALGLGTPAARLVKDVPGLLAALLAMVAVGVVMVVVSLAGAPALIPPATLLVAALVALGLDWRRVGRLRATTFASGPIVVIAVSVEQGWALPAAVGWLVVAIVALWLLQDDERRSTLRPAPLDPGPGDDRAPSLDLVRTLGLALLIGLAGAFLLGRPSCTTPDASPSQVPDLPYDRLPQGDPGGDPSDGSQRPAQPGEVPPEYRGDTDGQTPDGEPGPSGAGESEIQVDEQGNRYVEDPETGERYSVDEEGGREVIRDEDGDVVGEIDDRGVVARDGAGTEQRYRTDGDGRLYVEGLDGERYYLEEGGDGTAVLRDEDGDVAASQDPGDPDDHLVIRDPDGDVLVPDPNGDGEIPIPNRGVREGLPGWGGRTDYDVDDDGAVVATDRDGETRTYDQDWVGRERVRVERPGEPTRVFVYDETGPYLTVIEYDGEGRFVKRYRYDPEGVIVDTEPRGEDRTYDVGEGPTSSPSDTEVDGSGDADQDDPSTDDGEDRSYTPWILGGLGVLLLGGLGAWLLSRRKPAVGAVERSLAEALVVRIEEHGAAHGRPRRRAETIVAYTAALAAGPLPDPRLAGIGSLLSQALFGGAPPRVDDLTRAGDVLTEIEETHPVPTRADRRQAEKDAKSAAKATTR